MLPKVSLTNYEQCYQKRVKRLFQSHLNMKTYDKIIPNIERAVVGNIPPELIRIFPKETRGRDIKQFQTILSNLSKYLRASFKKIKQAPGFCFVDENYRQSNYIKDWVRDANILFNNCLKTLNADLTGEIQYIEHGAYANVFRLSMKDKNGNKIMHDKALKVYYEQNGLYATTKRIHGNYAEANFWTYLKHAIGHNLDKTQFTKHYISDMHSAYALTEFADKDIRKTSNPFNFKKILKIIFRDSLNNSPIFGKLYDGGGFLKGENFMDDKVVLRYYKKLIHRSPKELPEVLARYEALVQNPKTPHRDKIQKAIELFKEQKYINN